MIDDMTKQVITSWAARAMWGVTGVLGWDVLATNPDVQSALLTLMTFGVSWGLSKLSNVFVAKNATEVKK